MLKLSSVGRSSLCQLVSVSFLMIIVSSGLLNAVPGTRLADVRRTACNPSSPAIRPVIAATKSALEKVFPVASDYFRRKLNRSYTTAMEAIHNFKTDFRQIEGIPKYPGQPTPTRTLLHMNESLVLLKLYRNVVLVNFEIYECRAEAMKMNFPYDVPMLRSCIQDNESVQRELMKLLPAFNVTVPRLPPKFLNLRAKDKSEHIFRTWVVLHDYIIVLEYVQDVARFLLKEYCGQTMN